MNASIHRENAESIVETPVGRARIVASPGGICRMDFAEDIPAKSAASNAGSHSPESRQALNHVARAARQIAEYFAGRRKEFDVPLDLAGTPKQLRVWKALLGIPFGKTLSYGELARQVGSPRGARAVGAACGSNPVWLIVPCHRVVGSTGSLTGYGGGIWRKQRLLEHEGAIHPLLSRAAKA